MNTRVYATAEAHPGTNRHAISGLPQPLKMIQTPCLLLDEAKLRRNINRLRSHLRSKGVKFRPHLKTVKSLEIANLMVETPGGCATVSTLREAEAYADRGFSDLVYAVGIDPNKLERVIALRRCGVDLVLTLDSVEQASAVAAAGRQASLAVPVLIEIDVDGHRGGVRPDCSSLLEIAEALDGPGTELRGVLAHAGESYHVVGEEALQAAAEQESARCFAAAERLRAAHYACPIVSVGSTPTVLTARVFTGVTEVRAGVYAFFDLVMAGIGVCSVDDIAISVLATVIGHQSDRGWIIVDAGWSALSADRGTASQKLDQGYGLVCDASCRPIPDLIVIAANQEHGILSVRAGSSASVPDLRIGDRVRILPNHACATAAQHNGYQVLDSAGTMVAHFWPRIAGW
jgi:D-serine deaminase-like pyridoxal phosphate-dependent protein